ncbi:hypothetical protein IZ6_07870 [Terrihabitans soli]|uniref:Uncharacterized protein n=1 Tax=Terrihabitans soli TaxID=708113 RepID=A0A6S6QRZ9_9HYPH|nr:hypothetical protein [Terrihabitans soli]BCJ90052.1 hypothetical protein IZ6_07870 [Terrihabitans soli]
MAENAEHAWQTWQIVSAIVVFIFAILGAGAAARAWVDRRLEAEKHDRNVQVGTALMKADEAKALHHQLELQTKDMVHEVRLAAADAIHELELRVSKDYASFKMLNGVKEDLVDSMGEIKDSVNRMSDRFSEALVALVSKTP